MTQVPGSRQQRSSGSQPPFPGEVVVDDTRDFLSELDRFLQCANEFDLDQKHTELTVHPAATGEYFKNTRSRSDGDHEALYEDDLSGMSFTGTHNVGGLENICINAAELSRQQHDPVRVQPKSKRDHQTKALTVGGSKKRNQNRSRKRQREELEHLRTSAQQLQRELDMLLGGNPTAETSSSPDDANDLSYRSCQKEDLQAFVRHTLAWKRVAASEMQQTERAATENLRLRGIVAENMVLCKSFRETSSKHRFSKMPRGDLRLTHVNSTKPAVPRDVPDESAIFASLRQGLDAQYQRLGSVWDECKFTHSSSETRQPNRLKCDNEGTLYLEHARSRAFPFTADAVSRAFWNRIKGGVLTPNNGELKIRSIAGNTVYATLTDTISLPNAPESTIQVWITLKRFVEADQIATVWQARVDIENSTHTQLAERAWNVVKSIRKVRKTESSLDMGSCLLQTCIRSTLDPNCAVSKEELGAGRLTARVVAQYHENMSMLNQTIENYLLDESLARGSGSGSTTR